MNDKGSFTRKMEIGVCIPPRTTCVRATSLAPLVDHVLGQARTASEAADTLVVTANRNMLDALRCAGLPPEVEVLTYDEATQRIMMTDRAASNIGRATRVLLPAEEKVLLEDMKVSGLKVRRLREELKFLFKGLSEGADADESWLVNDEERSLLAFLLDHLREQGAILACERGSVSLRCLDMPDVRDAAGRSHVVVLGFTALDRCGQLAMARLATESLVALGCDQDAGVAQIAYPHPEGLDELVQAGAQLVDLDAAGASATAEAGRMTATQDRRVALRLAARSRADLPLERGTKPAYMVGGPQQAGKAAPTRATSAGADAAAPEVPFWQAATPTEEFACAARWARDAMQADTPANDLLIAVPNRAYLHGVATALHEAGLSYSPTERPFPTGDPRKADSRGAEHFVCALGLVADPDDMTCWRSWLGFGDWLLRSDAWEVLRRVAGEQSCGMAEALDLVRASIDPAGTAQLGPQAGALLKFSRALREGDELVHTCQGLRGSELLDRLAQTVGWQPGPCEQAVFAQAEGNDAASLWEAARRSVADGGCDRAGIAVACADDVAGSLARKVLVCGMADGYLPGRGSCDDNETLDKQAKRGREERRRLLGLVGAARASVSFSSFAECDVETAERSKLDIGRIFVRRGTRIATAKPSSLLWECQLDPQA